MTLLSRRDILEHQSTVPWASLRQVEQDLLLCRAMAAIFGDEFLHSQVAMRGGTLLHKVHLAPASRYSEDIDLVVFGDRPEDHIRKALRRALLAVLGKPQSSAWDSIALAIRNTVKPSREASRAHSTAEFCSKLVGLLTSDFDWRSHASEEYFSYEHIDCSF